MVKRKRTLFIMAGFGLFLLNTNPDLLLSKVMEDPMVQREEKIKTLSERERSVFQRGRSLPLKRE